MKNYKAKLVSHSNSRGSVLVLVGLLLVVFIGVAALSIDIGYLSTTKNELQNVADAAALAGAGVLGKIYQGDDTLTPIVQPLSYANQLAYDCSVSTTFPSGTYDITGATNDCEFIIEQAKLTAIQNRAAGIDVTIRTEDITIGQWKKGSFDPRTDQPDAVRVIARRDDSTVPIVTFFANIFNIDTMNVSAMATAALTGLGTAGTGELELPIGIPDTVFEGSSDDWCQTDISFSPPSAEGVCGGYTDFVDHNAVNPNGFNDLVDGSTDSPEIIANETQVGWNSGMSNVQSYEKLLEAYRDNGYDVDENGCPRLMLAEDGKTVIAAPALLETGLLPCLDINGNEVGFPLPAVPLTEQTPFYDGDANGNHAPVSVDNPQLNYPPCPGGSGNCTGLPRYKHVWQTGIVIYDHTTQPKPCLPTQQAKIVGFAEMRMKDALTAPDKFIVGTLLCNYVSEGDNRGGGGDYGKKGAIPGLVQ